MRYVFIIILKTTVSYSVNIKVIFINILITILDGTLSLKTINWIRLDHTLSMFIFIFSTILKAAFIFDIINNYINDKFKNPEPIINLFKEEDDLLSDLIYFEINNDLSIIDKYSEQILKLCNISSIENGKQMLMALKNQLTNYTSVKELEYDLLNKSNFIVYTLNDQSFIVNVYEKYKKNKKLCILHNISSYAKFKDNENLMNNLFYKVLPNLSEYIEIHNNDNVYTNNSCGPINIKNTNNIKIYTLSNQCIAYVSNIPQYQNILSEFQSEINDKVYHKITNRFQMKQIYKNQIFFNISDLLNTLYIQYKININIPYKCEIHGNKISLITILEFFLLNEEIPTLEKGNPLYIKIISTLTQKDYIKKDIINLLTYHGYEFHIENAKYDTLYIQLKTVQNMDLYIVNDEHQSNTEQLKQI